MTLVSLTLTATVKARARALGFDRIAIGPAERPPHGAAFDEWLRAGFAGTMSYLARGREDRLDPTRLLPGARSVVAVALGYKPASSDPAWRGIAAYARGRDYHDVMREKLDGLAESLRDAGGSDVRTRVAVDTSAVLERDLAARAGLGWIGKNTNLLTPGLGSMFFIGIVLTTAALAFDEAVPDRCGTCRACLDACPTDAFVAPYVLDARRCISYLTIEHRGEIETTLRQGLGEWLFGCDVCQDVCPWNAKAPPSGEPAFEPMGAAPTPAALLTLDQPSFRQRFRSSAISRARRAGLLRNAALVLGNAGGDSARAALRAATADPEPTVREAAVWGLAQLDRKS